MDQGQRTVKIYPNNAPRKWQGILNGNMDKQWSLNLHLGTQPLQKLPIQKNSTRDGIIKSRHEY